MRRDIVPKGSQQLNYEIRGIVEIAEKIESLGQKISWENVGDPVNKGEKIPFWMKEIIKDIIEKDYVWGYCPTKGLKQTRQFLADNVNKNQKAILDPENIVFFNGLGDAISRIYSLLKMQARVIGPSPAYPTHSSAEGAHSGYEQVTYKLDPKNNWLPDLIDLENKIKYNDSIVGILVINPDNPTGMVYPKYILEKFVELAKKYDLFLVSDEIYGNLVYNNAKMISLSEVIEDVPTIVMKGISKELPWPGARCGWIEVYNKEKDEDFSRYVKSIVDAKMLEVCSTTLPQAAIPQILSNENYPNFLEERTREIEKRANFVYETLKDVPGIIVNKTYGAFYTSIVFEDNSLNPFQSLKIENEKIRSFVEQIVEEKELDKRFVYYLLGACGICVVPLSSFCSDLKGFRITLLETDEEKFRWIFKILKDKLIEYLDN